MPKVSRKKTREQLEIENEELRARLDEAEGALQALRNGEAAALTIPGESGNQVFTLQGAESIYRHLIEEMTEGAVTLTQEGVILYCNKRFANMVGAPLEKVNGSSIFDWLTTVKTEALRSFLAKSTENRVEIDLKRVNGEILPAQFSTNAISTGDMQVVCLIASDVTERKQREERLEALLEEIKGSRLALLSVVEDQQVTEKRLRESEETARVILNAVTESLFLMDIDGNILAANATTADRLGKQVSDLIGANMYDFIPAENAQTRKGWVVQVLENKQGAHFEDLRRNRWLDNYIYPIVDEDGQVRTLTIYGQDITERKLTEQKVKESELKFRALFENAPLQSVIWKLIRNSQGQIVDWEVSDINPLGAASIGLQAKDAIGRRALDLFGAEVMASYLETSRQIAISGKPLLFETHFDSNGRDYLSSDFMVGSEHYANISMDISERKQAEAQKQQALDDLELERSLLRQLIDNLPDLIFLKDRESRFLVANQITADFMGVDSPEQLLGRSDFDFYPEQVAEKYFTTEQEIMQSGESLVGWERIQKDHAQNERWLSATKLPLRNTQGQIIGMVGIERDITERKQAERDLRASEEKYRSLVESLNSAVILVDKEGRFQYQNEIAANRLGTTPSNVIGKTVTELFPESTASMQLQHIKKVFSEDREIRFEEQVSIQAGTRWSHTSMLPVHDGQGKVISVLINVVDIHELKTAQQELLELNQSLEAKVKERSAQWQDLYDNAPVGYHSLDADGNFITVNQTELDWLGYTRQEMIGKPATILASSQGTEILKEQFSQIKRSGTVKNIEVEIVRKDGSTFPALVNGTAIYDADGNFISTRSTLADITERKRADKALRDSEEQNRLLFEESPVSLTLLDNKGDVTRSNRASHQLFGLPPEQLLKCNVRELGLLPQEEYDRLRDILISVQSQGQDSVAMEYSITRPDGSMVDVQSRIFPIVLGGSGHTLITSNDVTAYKKAEALLREANNQMEYALRMKDEFLANMSHELRTPLNAIIGISESLAEQLLGELNPKQLRYINVVGESGHHLLALINDILDLSKIEAGKIVLEHDKTSIKSVCQSSLNIIKELAQKKEIEIYYELDMDVDLIITDERRLKQMLVNLLGNAVKFTPDSGKIGLEVRGHRKNNQVTFTVWDTGIGIKEEDQARLFQPFVQVDGALNRSAGGTGLGLALVAQMARLHGGSVSLQSQVGVGSRFTITLPWNEVKPTARLSRGTALTKEEAQSSALAVQENRTILLVEDTEAAIMLISDYLEYAGYKVEVAKDGSSGISLAEKVKPDLILMDVQMPVMDGLEATRILRRLPQFKSTPIIGLTALAMSNDRERCIAAGMNDYLSKPVNMKNLVESVRRHLDNTEQEHKADTSF